MSKIYKPASFIEGVTIITVILTIIFFIIVIVRPNSSISSFNTINNNKLSLILLLAVIDILLIMCLIITIQMDKKIENNGINITGEIVSIKRNLFFKWGFIRNSIQTEDIDGSSVYPYIVVYRYKYLNNEYVSKSKYFWRKPDYNIGDNIPILIIENKPKRSLIKLNI